MSQSSSVCISNSVTRQSSANIVLLPHLPLLYQTLCLCRDTGSAVNTAVPTKTLNLTLVQLNPES